MARKILTICIYIFAAIGFILCLGYLAITFHLTKVPGIIDTQHDYFKDQLNNPTYAWRQTEEWKVLEEAIKKDALDINKAATVVDVEARMILAPLIVEQLRLFTTSREVFKAIFSPLKILGVASQYSWGVMGIKENTAKQIEAGLVDPQSPFYLGSKYEHLLDFTTDDRDAERFERLTDSKSRYYSYLYGAIYEKQLMKQWKDAKVDISRNPGVVATLFNIGFDHSKPHPEPKVGGAQIEIGDTTYSFGGLAAEFYYSDSLPEFKTRR